MARNSPRWRASSSATWRCSRSASTAHARQAGRGGELVGPGLRVDGPVVDAEQAEAVLAGDERRREGGVNPELREPRALPAVGLLAGEADRRPAGERLLEVRAARHVDDHVEVLAPDELDLGGDVAVVGLEHEDRAPVAAEAARRPVEIDEQHLGQRLGGVQPADEIGRGLGPLTGAPELAHERQVEAAGRRRRSRRAAPRGRSRRLRRLRSRPSAALV
jgi:hypothetical protein